MIDEIESQIQDKELEIERTGDATVKEGLLSYIASLNKDKKELKEKAKKMIDLSHKILVFLDNPRPELFNALMPLLSHDRYEVEYEYVDTHNGIKTRTNVLRGWPAVIFAQAIDYSHYSRYQEIQRRFIITSPKMTTEKYSRAVDHIGEKMGLPDFAYQTKVVSDSDKEKVRTIIEEIKEKVLRISEKTKPDKNNVFIPFHEAVTKSLPKGKASDMTTANRFFRFLSLLPLINIDKRPKLIVSNNHGHILQIIPIALFQDLRESEYLLRHANGVRPYILEWFNDVFLKAFNSKIEEDSANRRGEELREKRIAVTTRELIEKTSDIYKKNLSSKQILQTYINPLINENYIDYVDSEIDKRAHIYFPVLQIEYSNLFLLGEEDNNFQVRKIVIGDPTIYPDKQYLKAKVDEVMQSSSENDLSLELADHEGGIPTLEELVEQYYGKPEEYFKLHDSYT
jgi:hypothetical protein